MGFSEGTTGYRSTEPQVTEPQVTEPQVTEPQVTEPGKVYREVTA
jgi:hypothetical protein